MLICHAHAPRSVLRVARVEKAVRTIFADDVTSAEQISTMTDQKMLGVNISIKQTMLMTAMGRLMALNVEADVFILQMMLVRSRPLAVWQSSPSCSTAAAASGLTWWWTGGVPKSTATDGDPIHAVVKALRAQSTTGLILLATAEGWDPTLLADRVQSVALAAAEQTSLQVRLLVPPEVAGATKKMLASTGHGRCAEDVLRTNWDMSSALAVQGYQGDVPPTPTPLTDDEARAHQRSGNAGTRVGICRFWVSVARLFRCV